jgi:hypothetical protein
MDEPQAELDALTAAILEELALAPSDEGLSLPRLSKRLGLGASSLMRQLSALGSQKIGGTEGLGWVGVTRQEDRWMAALTPAGRLVHAAQVRR